MLEILAKLQQENVITAGDYHFAKMIAEKCEEGTDKSSRTKNNLTALLAALCNYSHQQGNTCLFLEEQIKSNLFGLAYRALEQDYLQQIDEKIGYLPVAQWQQILKSHIAFTTEPKTKIAPFVFQFNALYFYRVWQDEYLVARYLKSAVKNSKVLAEQPDTKIIHQLIGENTGLNQGQKIAIATALRQQFCLISGGPGTGKTYTVARLLVALQQLHQGKLQIKLAAPTGKAAARLTESIENALQQMTLSAKLKHCIPTEAMTIHRLLGGRSFKFNAQNPLPLDVLVIDEASMIDLALMSNLLQALPSHARLILLGDKDQLASVEAGAILGELGQFLEQGYSASFIDYLNRVTDSHLAFNSVQGDEIRDYLSHLTESRRFDEKSAIGHLAKAINSAEIDRSLQLFSQLDDIEYVDFNRYFANGIQPESSAEYLAYCVNLVVERAVREYRDYLLEIETRSAKSELTEQDIEKIFAGFKKVRFLSALRLGELGVEKLNLSIAEGLRRQNLIQFKNSRDWYQGKPVMIIQNDANVGLFNGDIGLFIQGKVWFELGENHYRRISPSRIPSHETAFVMTVHKSQGSEFNHAFLVLPTENVPVLSRELVYTAVTRAKQRFTLFATDNIWKSAVRKQVKRQSGLGRLLIENI
ncbi:exodeoxyribonuclease V subunit alpha [[Mannheimia] succiniciproducens]|uniref:RecBCD enzyme subunit RecD n=1 Tax=Mannheimia succiniciproducens (strain KCTC 0769BP / MBEL55E) TaxID=221988 RepID=Q65TK5_MANSM|nr:exodeoxyribonuclease V subunit alpha [[Mannheimia] succiniciproducens]AAU37705.1 RecD protein [[Mannheimia] succiniciproducens MBEL55E]